jgi:hypothetical protein
MKRTVWIAVFAIALSSPATRALAQDEPEAPEVSTEVAEDAENGEESLSDLTVPGEPHELLAGTVGDWDLSILIWATPDTEPVESTGSATGRWILGDRFVETTYEGEAMGRPFEALKIEGFEKATQEYVTTWRDNLGTHTMIFRGKCGITCEVRTMMADFVDPISKTALKIKGVTTLTEEEGYSYESFVVTSDGNTFKNMELVATKRVP